MRKHRHVTAHSTPTSPSASQTPITVTADITQTRQQLIQTDWDSVRLRLNLLNVQMEDNLLVHGAAGQTTFRCNCRMEWK